MVKWGEERRVRMRNIGVWRRWCGKVAVVGRGKGGRVVLPCLTSFFLEQFIALGRFCVWVRRSTSIGARLSLPLAICRHLVGRWLGGFFFGVFFFFLFAPF